MATVKDIYDIIDASAPFDTQFEWDNAGLLIGDFNCEVSKTGVALDATCDVINEAIKCGCNLLVTHHPVIFTPLKSVDFDNPVSLALKNNLNIICAHTNLDFADKGVNDALVRKLELNSPEVINIDNEKIWMGTVDEISPDKFAEYISEKLGGMISYCPSDKNISKVAVCGGAAGEYMYEAYKSGMDAFITGEVHHHEYLDAKRLGISLFCAGHFETENPVVSYLKELIQSKSSVETIIIDQERPVKYYGYKE